LKFRNLLTRPGDSEMTFAVS